MTTVAEMPARYEEAAAPEQAATAASAERVSPLMRACLRDDVNEVQRILGSQDARPDLLDAADEDGLTPLLLAVISGQQPLLTLLLERGADKDWRDHERHSAVHWATVCGELGLLDVLLEAGANASTPDIHGAYPIHYAAQMCGPNSEMATDVRVGLLALRRLLAAGVDVHVVDHDGRQPLLWAASAGSSDALVSLVNAGASVAAADKDGLTALHCAASRGHTDCIDTLVTLCGADVDVMDSNGCTALFYAVTLGHADCTELLLRSGAEPNRQDRKGRTPAHCGAAKGQIETVKMLARYSASLGIRNVRGDLPLHEAVRSGRKELVRWLLQQRPESVNHANNEGRCPLHTAAMTNNVEMCKVLMDLHAQVNPLMRSSTGQLMTPLDSALSRGSRSCAKYLQLHGGASASALTDLRSPPQVNDSG
ncbi:ankyrin homolog [Pollicipes pollicipes]|uniref:ankyrin homolog n=1 Tax=Pollicipes pollicipes TaxID=41117 RepID=UPI001884A194|nr:ankyrin homolog [Pollicipes pollicipes]